MNRQLPVQHQLKFQKCSQARLQAQLVGVQVPRGQSETSWADFVGRISSRWQQRRRHSHLILVGVVIHGLRCPSKRLSEVPSGNSFLILINAVLYMNAHASCASVHTRAWNFISWGVTSRRRRNAGAKVTSPCSLSHPLGFMRSTAAVGSIVVVIQVNE